VGDRWIAFGGWAVSPAVLTPLFRDPPLLIDVNEIAPSLVRNGRLRPDWETVVADHVKVLSNDRLPGIAGWSTGSIMAYAAAQRLKPKVAMFLGATPSFCRRPGFPYGWKPAALKAMREKLETDPHGILHAFCERCGIALPLPATLPAASPPNPLSTSPRSPLPRGEGNGKTIENSGNTEAIKRPLIDGLHFLEQASLIPVAPLPCPSLFMHGREDAIVPFQAGKMFADAAGGRFLEYDGGHGFFVGREGFFY
jgi:pimeloyl-ACP methyl ester carboxylesterase